MTGYLWALGSFCLSFLLLISGSLVNAQVDGRGLTRVPKLDSVGTSQGRLEQPNRSNCPANRSTAVASLSVSFGYPGSHLSLGSSPFEDGHTYHRIAAGFTPPITNRRLTDSTSPHTITRERFLASTREMVQNAQHINFNFAGHGVNINGQVHLVMPSITAHPELRNCLVSTNSRGLEPAPSTGGSNTCEGLQEHLVSAADLRQIFGNRKVFGIIDACHSGGFDLGPHSSMILSAQADQTAGNTHPNDGGGVFTRTLASFGDEYCNLDHNQDGQVSFHEFGRQVAFNTSGARRTPGGAHSEGQQDPVYNLRSWTECYVFANPLPAQQGNCRRVVPPTILTGQVGETVGPAELLTRDQAGQLLATEGCAMIAPGTRVRALADSTNESHIGVEVLDGPCRSRQGLIPTRLYRLGPSGPAPGRPQRGGSVR